MVSCLIWKCRDKKLDSHNTHSQRVTTQGDLPIHWSLSVCCREGNPFGKRWPRSKAALEGRFGHKNKIKKKNPKQLGPNNAESRRTRSWEKHRQPQLLWEQDTSQGKRHKQNSPCRSTDCSTTIARAQLEFTPNLAPGLTIRCLSKEAFKAGETQLCPVRPEDSTWQSPTTARPVSASPPASAGDHQHAERRLGF